MTQKICFRNKFGYCKYCERCRFRHENEQCEDNECEVYNCEKRHPRNCKHFRQYGYCKFTTFCKFKHIKQVHIAENSDKTDKLEKKLETLHIPKENKRNEEDLSKIKSFLCDNNVNNKGNYDNTDGEVHTNKESKSKNTKQRENQCKFSEGDFSWS